LVLQQTRVDSKVSLPSSLPHIYATVFTMYLRCLVLILLCRAVDARRSMRVIDFHQDAQQQNNTLATGRKVSAVAREALIPEGLGAGIFRRAGPQMGAPIKKSKGRAVPSFRRSRFGPQRTKEAVMALQGMPAATAPYTAPTTKKTRSRGVEAREVVTEETQEDAGTIGDGVELRSEFLQRMQWRGFLAQATDLSGIDAKLMEGTVVAYLGFDATAPSLHVGSLLQIMMLRHFQQCGHKPIVLVGGATTKVGDPTGKDASRQLLHEATIAENIAGISSVFEKFLKFGNGPTDAVIVNNDDWLSSLRYLEFLRDYGRYFTINRMLSFESVKQRLARESPFSFLEFNYMILQAYDFLELSRRYGVSLQFGGSDQWGNIINGVELARKVDGTSLYGLTAPLLATADGKKMGKTASGAVWLNAAQLSPFDYWQFWRNTADADVGRFLRIFTELPRNEIERLESLQGAEINAAKVMLADEATKMLHGTECLGEIRATAESLFSTGGGPAELSSLPRVSVKPDEISDGVAVIDLFLRLGFCKSRSEVRRLIAGGGARLNGEKIDDPAMVIGFDNFSGGKEIKISSGKKKFGIIELAA